MLFIGASVGILIGALLFSKSDDQGKTVAEKESIKVVTEKIKDTVVVSEKVYVEVPIADTLAEDFFQDTVQIDTSELSTDTIPETGDPDLIIIENDGDDDDDFEVIKDQLLNKKIVRLTIIDFTDTLTVDKALNKDVLPFSEQLAVEFWTSPLELTGYELAANKLKLFGFHPDEKLTILFTKGTDFLEVRIGDAVLRLGKTERFKTIYL